MTQAQIVATALNSDGTGIEVLPLSPHRRLVASDNCPPSGREPRSLGAFVAVRCHTVCMYFRLTYEVTGYQVDSEPTVVFRIGGPRSVSIVIQHLSGDSEQPRQKRI